MTVQPNYHWQFAERKGATTIDAIGGVLAKMSNTTWLGHGRIGGAIKIDGRIKESVYFEPWTLKCCVSSRNIRDLDERAIFAHKDPSIPYKFYRLIKSHQLDIVVDCWYRFVHF